jgi:hypothetical protein
MVQSVYQGQPNTKFVCWVIDRADGKVKLYCTPKTILEVISGYEDDEQFGFKALPMPYDVTINARGRHEGRQLQRAARPGRGADERGDGRVQRRKSRLTRSSPG